MEKMLSPEVQMKLSNMEAAYRLRKGSPDFRNALRQRCRHQVKARRSALFDNIRNTRSKLNIQETLSKIFSSELNLLQSDMKESAMEVCQVSKPDDTFNYELEILEQIKNEIIQEQESWILAEYDKYLENDLVLMNSAEENVVCPICLRFTLIYHGNTVQCPNNCINFPPFWSLSDIHQSFQYAMQQHDSECPSCAQFVNFFESEIQGLHLICHECSFFHKILPGCF